MPTSSLPRFFAAASPHRLAVLKALWPTVVGSALSNHSEVVGIEGDVMRVRTDAVSWLKTLRDLKGTLVLRLQRTAGPMAPRALAFVEGPVAPKAPRKEAVTRPRPIPLSELPAAVRGASERIPTAEGREIYLRAVAAFKARFGPTPHPP